MHGTLFSRIAAATTSKQAWPMLQKEFQGSTRVITVKLQALRQDFETISMKNNETVQEFVSRMMAIIDKMRTFGDKITDQTVVAKVLRSLTPGFDHVVAAIEESKDLTQLSIDELSGSLQAHEVRMNKSAEKSEEKAFQAKVDITNTKYYGRMAGRGQGRGFHRAKIGGRGRGRHIEQR